MASSIVDIALLVSLIFWILIQSRVPGRSKIGARYYVVCFALYVFGQSLVLLASLKIIQGWSDISNYSYALAAILFAVGSYYQYRSLSLKK